MTSSELSKFYYTAMNAQPVEFWNTSESIDAHRNIAHVLKQYPSRIISPEAYDTTGGQSAAEIAAYLERRADRIETYGENYA